MIDLHSHLLPGLDDGPEEVSETLEIIKVMSSFGYIEIIPTPHKFHALFNPDPNIVMGRISALNKTMIRRFSFEYMCNIPRIRELTDHREFSRTSDGYKVIMVEFHSPLVSKKEIDSSVFSLNAGGFIPLLAHIERYLKDDEFWLELRFLSVIRQNSGNSIFPHQEKAGDQVPRKWDNRQSWDRPSPGIAA